MKWRRIWRTRTAPDPSMRPANGLVNVDNKNVHMTRALIIRSAKKEKMTKASETIEQTHRSCLDNNYMIKGDREGDERCYESNPGCRDGQGPVPGLCLSGTSG